MVDQRQLRKLEFIGSTLENRSDRRFLISISMSRISALVLAFLCALSFANLPPIAAADSGEALSAYEVLQSYNFPVGLLPKGVTGYDLDKSTGKFNAYLNGSCSFSLEGSYQLKYRSTISGFIAKDRLTSLNGISVKVFFMWVNIVEVARRGEELNFSVGIASAAFTIDNFAICPQCGCGLDCNSNGKGQVREIGTNLVVSSV
ncbi:uncharacterized protein LOC127798873 [Diospyros lotus]|uniref:uncharacterized protein LOC127798873 n=1 Tax=Diospyros lotus TaxID=55363 RepID=UPI002259A560|nr:uncharacterized protein LOC127798873 [Diospyros lotus]